MRFLPLLGYETQVNQLANAAVHNTVSSLLCAYVGNTGLILLIRLPVAAAFEVNY